MTAKDRQALEARIAELESYARAHQIRANAERELEYETRHYIKLLKARLPQPRKGVK